MKHPTHELGDKKWHFNRDGKLEEVPVERWAWGAVLKNGTEMHQYDAQGVFHQIGEIPQEEVKLWVLYKTGPENKRIDFVMPKGARLIHKYKRYVLNSAQFNEGKEENEVRETVYVFGYKLGNHYHYNFIMPNDTIVQSVEEVPVFDFGLDQIAADARAKK